MMLISDIYIYVSFTGLFRQLHVPKLMEAFLKQYHNKLTQ